MCGAGKKLAIERGPLGTTEVPGAEYCGGDGTTPTLVSIESLLMIESVLGVLNCSFIVGNLSDSVAFFQVNNTYVLNHFHAFASVCNHVGTITMLL